jgi:nucleotide-binding universal stress UspA family protein
MSKPLILVPLDGSMQALAALPVAKVFSEIEKADLHIVHVSERAMTEAQLRSRLGHKASVPDDFTINARVGTPATEILQVAEEIKPQVIVLCRHSSAERGKMLGHTAMKVLHNARCPVVLVPPERGARPWHLQRVMVPHDGTPTTSAALQPAAVIAEHGRAELLVVHVTGTRATLAEEPGSFTAPRYVDQPQHEWPAWTSEFVNRLACLCPLSHLHVRMLLAHGNTAAEVLRLSERQSADLIVLAWRGKWEPPRAATIKDILRKAHCPIMVVRT